jgi:hypothetical protein
MGLLAASQILLDDAHKESNDPYQIGERPKVRFDVAASNGEGTPDRKGTYFSQLARQTSRSSLNKNLEQSVSGSDSAPDDSIKLERRSSAASALVDGEDSEPPVDPALRKRLLYAIVFTSFLFSFVTAQGFSIYPPYLGRSVGKSGKELAGLFGMLMTVGTLSGFAFQIVGMDFIVKKLGPFHCGTCESDDGHTHAGPAHVGLPAALYQSTEASQRLHFRILPLLLACGVCVRLSRRGSHGLRGHHHREPALCAACRAPSNGHGRSCAEQHRHSCLERGPTDDARHCGYQSQWYGCPSRAGADGGAVRRRGGADLLVRSVPAAPQGSKVRCLRYGCTPGSEPRPPRPRDAHTEAHT